jgi:hypothetical protein
VNNIEFVSKLKDVATKHKTLYVMGCFGAPMTETNKKRYINHHSYNKTADRTSVINAATADTFGFDCVCLIKGVLWGWNGNEHDIYGGADYAINGVPDIDANSMINVCSGLSTDFSNVEIGEAVWIKDHIGVYIGDGLVVECTPRWKNGVQITACNTSISGYNRRDWTKHGKLPYIEYVKSENKQEEIKVDKKGVYNMEMRVLKRGCKGEDVRALQILLSGRGCNGNMYTPDGSFGPNTEGAVKLYQKKMGLVVDGIAGPATMTSLLGAE